MKYTEKHGLAIFEDDDNADLPKYSEELADTLESYLDSTDEATDKIEKAVETTKEMQQTYEQQIDVDASLELAEARTTTEGKTYDTVGERLSATDEAINQNSKDIANNTVNIETLRTKGSAVTYTVDIADLQATINSLPKLLNYDVTINVNEGIYDGTITIENFFGNGILKIVGSSLIATTRNINRLVCSHNTLSEIIAEGFNFLATSDSSFKANGNTSRIRCQYLKMIEGLNTLGANIGVGVNNNAGSVNIYESEISNKYRAIYCEEARVRTSILSGTNNATIYYAIHTGQIYKQNVGTITGTTTNSYTGAGLIVNPSGGTIGS